METITISVPVKFKPFLDASILRFQYLFPEISVDVNGGDVVLSCFDKSVSSTIKQELFHLIYREKILAETLEVRTHIYKAISND